MAVNLSPVGGVAAQFFTNTGAVLTGGKLYTYLAGTTTPATTYTTSAGNVARTNPIVLDAAGRVSGSGEIWLTQDIIYKFSLTDSNDVLIGTYDNISGISSLTLPISSNNVTYTPAGGGAVATTVQAKLRQTVSITDFGADPTGVVNASTAIANAIAALPAAGGVVTFPSGTYLGHIDINRSNVCIEAFGATLNSDGTNPAVLLQIPSNTIGNVSINDLALDGDNTSTQGVRLVRSTRCLLNNLFINKFKNHGIFITGDGVGAGTQTQVQMCRIDAASSPDSGAAGIYIGGGGVNTTVRLFNNYITNYEIGLSDAGINTVGVGNIYELAINPVITGADGVYIGDWMESGSMLSPDFYSVTDSRVTIVGPHDTTAANVVSGAPGQYPAYSNRIATQDLVVQGPTVMADGGLQYYSPSIGGAVLANAPKNLRGFVQVTGANTSATVTFTLAEPNASYFIVATPVDLINTPAAGSNRVTSISKSTTGFTLNVETAPGGAGIVTFNWIMVR